MPSARRLELSAPAAAPAAQLRMVAGIGEATALLTHREREVIGLVAEGFSTRAIAARLDISPNTVETHVRAAREKLGARTRTEAAARASSVRRAAPACRLRGDQRRLLELLAGGATLGEAARHLALSRRTADRRLSQARGALGVASTAQAVLAVRAGEAVEGMAHIEYVPSLRTVVASG